MCCHFDGIKRDFIALLYRRDLLRLTLYSLSYRELRNMTITHVSKAFITNFTTGMYVYGQHTRNSVSCKTNFAFLVFTKHYLGVSHERTMKQRTFIIHKKHKSCFMYDVQLTLYYPLQLLTTKVPVVSALN